jgi:hypothetical protein
MKSPKVKAGHEIEEKRNYAEDPAQALQLPASWQSASFMALRKLRMEVEKLKSKRG